MNSTVCFLRQKAPYTFFPQFQVLCTGLLHFEHKCSCQILSQRRGKKAERVGLKGLHYSLALYPMCPIASQAMCSADICILDLNLKIKLPALFIHPSSSLYSFGSSLALPTVVAIYFGFLISTSGA